MRDIGAVRMLCVLLLAASGCVASGPTFRPERLPSAIWWNFRTCTPECVAGGSTADASASLQLANVAFELRNYEVAGVEQERALCLNLESPDVWRLLALSYAHQSRRPEAFCAFKECLKRNAGDHTCGYGIAHLSKLIQFVTDPVDHRRPFIEEVPGGPPGGE